MPITANDLAALGRLLDQAMELASGEREEWFKALSKDDRHLAPMLREMLAERDTARTSGFLSSMPALPPRDVNEDFATAGELIGPYRLIREIGRGGMGTVWLADRADGTFKRQVALKLPRLAWGAGLAERMSREREIGALLEHPSIARLYDAGVDGRGRPFLALEYIDGVQIDVWCKEKTPSIRDCLKLIVQIARAVSYAHGRLVVHRDLKPSNVLVTADGQIHLLDFGIAKLLNEAASDGDGLTRDQGRVLTPHYASPEQLRGEAITVQSDVYSMGVLAYELLTGCTPYRPKRSTLGALEEEILEGEPARASSRSSHLTTAKALRGEIDSILAKALRREPSERYATADAFASDIERHLSGERVLAQPDSLAYRWSKVLLRHRVAFAATGAVLVAVIAGSAVSMVQARRANEAAERAQVVKEFVVDVLKVNSPSGRADADMRQLPAEVVIERGAALIDDRFSGQPALRAELYGVVGRVFLDMGAAQQAAHYAKKQVDLLATVNGSAGTAVADAHLLMARALLMQRRLDAAEVASRRALQLSEPYPDRRTNAQLVLAEVLRAEGGKDDEVRRWLALIGAESKPGMPPTALSARAKLVRAGMLDAGNRFDAALPLSQSAIEDALVAEGPLSQTAIEIRIWLANRLLWYGRYDESIAPRESALKALRASGLAGEMRAALLESAAARGMVNAGMIAFPTAVAKVEQDIAFVRSKGELAPERILPHIELNLAAIYLYAGDYMSVDSLVTRVVPVVRRLDAGSKDDLMLYDFVEGFMSMNMGRNAEADLPLREVLTLAAAAGTALRPSASYDYGNVAMNLAIQGRFAEAKDFLAKAPVFGDDRNIGPSFTSANRHVQLLKAMVALYENEPGNALALMPEPAPDSHTYVDFKAITVRGEILCALGQRAEGLRLLREALQIQAQVPVFQNRYFAHDPNLFRLRAVTGLCALAAGRHKEASELGRLARVSVAMQPSVSRFFTEPSYRLDAMLQALR
ncbi:MAG: serine/threonine-protein kinase [Burkholderiaceae bacterium]